MTTTAAHAAHAARAAAQLREAARDVARVAELRSRCADLPPTAEWRVNVIQASGRGRVDAHGKRREPDDRERVAAGMNGCSEAIPQYAEPT